MFQELTYGFDLPLMQWLQGSGSMFMDQFMFTVSQAWTWIPIYLMLLLLFFRNNDNLKEVLLTIGFVLLCFAIVDVTVDVFVKPNFQRWRPTQDPMLKYTINVVNNYRGGKFSFFSAHAANTMSIAVFIALLVRSKMLSSVLIFWSLLNGLSRIYLGVHYPSDVLVGWIFGTFVAVCCFFVYKQVMRTITPKDTYVSEAYTHNGYSLIDCYYTSVVVLLCIVFCIFKALI